MYQPFQKKKLGGAQRGALAGATGGRPASPPPFAALPPGSGAEQKKLFFSAERGSVAPPFAPKKEWSSATSGACRGDLDRLASASTLFAPICVGKQGEPLFFCIATRDYCREGVKSGLVRGRAESAATLCFAHRNLMIWGSSETACRTRIQVQKNSCVLHVRSYLSAHRPKHKPLQPNDTTQFGFFLAGLIDSDGHINKQPQLVIAFHSFEVRCAYWIKSMIGYGSVRKVKAKQAYTYVLTHRDGLRKVAELVHNKLRHPSKIDQYNKRLAQSYELKHTSFQPLPILSNHWLAGFIFGDGSFAIRVLLQRGKASIEGNASFFSRILRPVPEVRLECKVDQKYKTLLEPIQEAIGGYIGHRKRLDTYYYSTVSFRSASKLLHYLDQYQLIGLKYTQYVLWRRAFLIIQEKRHLSPNGVHLIKAIQLRIKQLKAIGREG
jgi:hypothetical protein